MVIKLQQSNGIHTANLTDLRNSKNLSAKMDEKYSEEFKFEQF